MKRTTAVLAACGVLLAQARGEGEWKKLFNGNDLEGWVQRGGKAEYKVEDGCIVGYAVKGTPNSFLCTPRNYGNFELEYEAWVEAGKNSGVQIRSECFEEARTVEWQGKTIKISAGRVHGYQVELDPSDRAWSAGIYDEGRRGWLANLKDNEAARKAFRRNEWNRFRVLCEGDRIRTWINDVPAADLRDGMTLEGFIGLQVHSAPASGLAVKWRNLRIRELKGGAVAAAAAARPCCPGH